MAPSETLDSVLVLARHNAGVAFVIERVSIGGVCLAGPLTLETGEHVGLVFELAGTQIEIDGEVIDVERLDMMIDRVAIAFRNLSTSTRAVVLELAQRSLDLADASADD